MCMYPAVTEEVEEADKSSILAVGRVSADVVISFSHTQNIDL